MEYFTSIWISIIYNFTDSEDTERNSLNTPRQKRLSTLLICNILSVLLKNIMSNLSRFVWIFLPSFLALNPSHYSQREYREATWCESEIFIKYQAYFSPMLWGFFSQPRTKGMWTTFPSIDRHECINNEMDGLKASRQETNIILLLE